MYKNNEKQMMLPDDFFLPFGGKLNKENRWVKLANIIPWWEFEDKHRKNFRISHTGEQAFSVRVALGTLIIKTKLGISDDETVNQIAENPYLQYFLGFPKFQEGMPFASSLITHFRKRFNADILNEVNEKIASAVIEKKQDDDSNPPTAGGGSGQSERNETSGSNSGKMIMDATCTPADIQYPTIQDY